jgi:hypothetical protein
MNGLQLAWLLLVLYTGTLAAFIVACALVPRVRAWYVSHVRAYSLLLLPAIVALWVLLGVSVTR